ncbi:hypothetical protein NEMBOFW57_009199 [Staphylotrichum longicolle]|uniref:CHAT domain-containing protein n=1 Tax=Staphylotrichum longicolle TaxID=669026 RepID=A0AAD4ET33_9PEZI|nr:hypothetical protein NEMBOFW57_009199 [Staphylotrichum longicolle]
MSIFAGVAADVCALLLASDQPTNALECLEKGRAVIIGQLIDRGTIVVVNITKFRSDAVLVSRGAVKALSLPGLRASDAEAWLGKKWTGRGVRRDGHAQKNKEYLKYLAWLWDVSTENAFSKAVSSYTPSIKALWYAQERARATDGARGALLIVAMPTTPGQVAQPDSRTQQDTRKPPDLPGVAEETKKITDIVNGHVPIEPLDLPSVDQAVDKLTDCYIAHFTCHGLTDHADPSNSGLILQKRGEGQEAEQDRLTVHRGSELSLAHARIAYLSACSTAENGAARLSDEVIHVVSGFQVAGFPYVVGCLWPSIDWVRVEVSSGFYGSLLRRRGARWDGGEVARAVREAVMAVREAEMDRPLAWAQFVHFGA